MNEYSPEFGLFIIVVSIWIFIASVIAIIQTLIEKRRVEFSRFFSLLFTYTLKLFWSILQIIGNLSKDSSDRDRSRVIEKVQFRNGSVHVSSNGLSFSRHCDELANWNSNSVTIKRKNGKGYFVETLDPNGRTIDSYFE